MENTKAILLLAAIALAGVSVFLFVAYTSANAKATEAQALGIAVRDLLRAQRTPCSAGANQYARLAACVQPLLAERDFKEDAFKQPDARTGALYNRAQIQEGCKDLTGTVDKDVTCRFDFLPPCEKGAVLEVTYPIIGDDGQSRPVRVFLKTC